MTSRSAAPRQKPQPRAARQNQNPKARAARQKPQSRAARLGGLAFGFAIVAAFAAALLLPNALWAVPGWLVLVYAALSILSVILYAGDKSAAIAGRRRIPEKTLLGLGLLGGWPGAIIAQQAFRHKIRKPAFMRVFVGTVVANVAVLVLVSTPLGATALCSVAGCP